MSLKHEIGPSFIYFFIFSCSTYIIPPLPGPRMFLQRRLAALLSGSPPRSHPPQHTLESSLHPKQATLSPHANVSSHLLSWQRAHTCRLTILSDRTLVLHQTRSSSAHDRPGLMERSGRDLPGSLGGNSWMKLLFKN